MGAGGVMRGQGNRVWVRNPTDAGGNIRQTPDAMEAPLGPGGQMGTAWQNRFAEQQLREVNHPALSAVRNLKIGENAFWAWDPDQRSPEGQPLFRLWVRPSNGMEQIRLVDQVVDGRPTGMPMLFDLTAGQRQRELDYMNNERDAAQRAIDEAPLPDVNAPVAPRMNMRRRNDR
jgi:hypothetical protein